MESDLWLSMSEHAWFPVCTERLCVNVTIFDDNILEEEELLSVSVYLSGEAIRNGIVFNDPYLDIRIVDNDNGELLLSSYGKLH